LEAWLQDKVVKDIEAIDESKKFEVAEDRGKAGSLVEAANSLNNL